MTLIEGVGDEVTILVTVIVAVTTIVAAWFSTSVHEQQSYWQEDDPGSIVDPSSLIDPDPPSQESNSSANESGISASGSIDGSAPDGGIEQTEDHCVGATAFPQNAPDDESTVVDDLKTCCNKVEEEDVVAAERSGETTKRGSASQSSSFEYIEAACVNNLANDSNTASRCLDFPKGPDVTDGISTYSGPPVDVVQERVEDLQLQGEEQCVRRRTVPKAEALFDEAAVRTADDGTHPAQGSSQSEAASHAETKLSSQPEGVSQTDVRTSGQSYQQIRDQTASGVIAIKLRFLDETERIVSTNMDDTLGNFRRETFAAEIQSGQTVRFISNGQLLSDDSRTLASYGIANQHVIHCQLSRAPVGSHGVGGHHGDSGGGGGGEAREGGDFDLGRYMVPLFACILAFVWYLRFQYRYMFNATSTLSLTAVTAVFVLALLAVWRS